MSIERAGGIQILKGTPVTLSVTFYDAGSVADPGEVTVTITDADGTAVATDATTEGTDAAARTYALTAAQAAELTTFTVEWTSATLGTVATHAEVVGDLLFTLAEARAFDGGALSSDTDYPDNYLAEGRTRIAEAFREICGVAFGRRYERAVLDGDGGESLLLPDIRVSSVRSIETRSGQTWTAFDADQLADVVVYPYGALVRDTLGCFPPGRRNVRVGYEHGHERVPLEIRRAALIVLRDSIKSNVSDRATSISDEFGTFRLSTAGIGKNNWFGLPQADSALARYVERIPGIG